MKVKSFLCFTLAALSALCCGAALGKDKGMPIATAMGDMSVEGIEEVGSPTAQPTATAEGKTGALPSSYCMRDEYIVYAQHQDKQGYCWNFAGTMSASTTIMRHTNEYYDFSELWNGISCLYANNGYTQPGAGGNFIDQFDGMRRGGLMLESDLPYQESYTVSSQNADEYYNFFHQYANDDLADCLQRKSFSRTKVEEIKQHIYNHGSAYMAFTFRTGYVPDENGITALPPNQKNTNSAHAVSVIGWDDNYQREFYLNGSSTPTLFKGAWILLNSYTETSGTDGLSFVFYDDTNLYDINGYEYRPNTNKELYFYDKIEEGYAYPNHVKGKYCGNFIAQEGTTKQKNIFYDDVNLVYSYTASEGTGVEDIAIYLNNVDVTKAFDVQIDNANQSFSIAKDNAQYGHYKIVVTYGNGVKSDTYLNNFFVTYGLIGEEQDIDTESNNLPFNVGRDLEYHSIIQANKDYVFYTDQTSGTLSFLPVHQSVYSDKNMSIPTLTYNITNGQDCTVTHTVTSTSGYALDYNFHVEYCEDTTLQPVKVYYDLNGGINHPKNYSRELANATTDLVLYAPTREGYTFKGWCLDYGNGTQGVRQEGDVSYVDWDVIHHMGESPNLYASGYYKQYYKNSNVLFVYARWEEVEYHNVEINIVGNGTTQLDKKISIGPESSVKYVFTPSKGWCLSDVAINGVSVTSDELAKIVNNGLQLSGVTEDLFITATFSEGTQIALTYGKGIKTAYLQKEYQGQTLKFYNGDYIPSQYTKNSYSNYFTLIVELEECPDGVYVLENISSYNYLGDGAFTKEISIYRNSSIKEIAVGSAVKEAKGSVRLHYTIGGYTTSHYISSNVNATEGVLNVGWFEAGSTAYVFIRKPKDTNMYYYVAPDDFESIGDRWYRKKIYVCASNAELGSFRVEVQYQTHMVIWTNWDNKVIYMEEYEYWDFPSYDESEYGTPIKPEDEKYTYTFIGWSPALQAVAADVAYKAVFQATLKEYTISVSPSENGTISSAGDGTVTYFDALTYTFIPDEGYKVKDVVVDGISVGAVETYTFKETARNHTLAVEFEVVKNKILVYTEGNGSAFCEESLEEVPFGESRTLILTADETWRILYAFINGVQVDVTNGQLLIENVTADIYVSVVFVHEYWKEKETYNVAVETVGGGSVTPSGNGTVTDYDLLTYTFTPDEGYEIKDVLVNGTSVGAVESYTFANVTEDQTLAVEFQKITYSVNVLCGGNGSVDQTGVVAVEHGGTLTLNITPAEGYGIDFIKVNGAAVEAAQALTVSDITKDTVVEIAFKKTVFSVTTLGSGKGSVTPTFDVELGKEARVNFSAKLGYKVKDVKIDGVSVGAVEQYTFLDTNGDHTVEVSYELDIALIIAASAAAVIALGMISLTAVIIRIYKKFMRAVKTAETYRVFMDITRR